MLPLAPALVSLWQPAQPAAVKICSPVVAPARPALASAPSSSPVPVRRVGDVGGHVLGVLALHEPGRHHAVAARMEDLPVDDALDRVATDALRQRRAEGGVQVGAGLALRCRRCASVWQEPHFCVNCALPLDEVGLVAAAGAKRAARPLPPRKRRRRAALPCSGRGSRGGNIIRWGSGMG